MKLQLEKGHRYYNIQTQLSLFGNEDLICTWGSLNTKRGNHKIINCNNTEDIQNNLKRIIKLPKKRGYNIASPSTKFLPSIQTNIKESYGYS